MTIGMMISAHRARRSATDSGRHHDDDVVADEVVTVCRLEEKKPSPLNLFSEEGFTLFCLSDGEGDADGCRR